MLNSRAKSARRGWTVNKSVNSSPSGGFLQISSIQSLTVNNFGSCQLGSIFNFHPLRRGGHFDGIDEFESKKRRWGYVLTLLLTPRREMRDMALGESNFALLCHDIAHGKPLLRKSRFGRGLCAANARDCRSDRTRRG